MRGDGAAGPAAIRTLAAALTSEARRQGVGRAELCDLIEELARRRDPRRLVELAVLPALIALGVAATVRAATQAAGLLNDPLARRS